MKSRLVICSALFVGLLAGCVSEKHEGGNKEAKQARLEAQAKVSKAEAERIALGTVPGGTVKEGELEKEKGKLIWSFDIATAGTRDITEVHVDAVTGKVVRTEHETVADQEKEKKADKKKKDKEDEKEEKK